MKAVQKSSVQVSILLFVGFMTHIINAYELEEEVLYSGGPYESEGYKLCHSSTLPDTFDVVFSNESENHIVTRFMVRIRNKDENLKDNEQDVVVNAEVHPGGLFRYKFDKTKIRPDICGAGGFYETKLVRVWGVRQPPIGFVVLSPDQVKTLMEFQGLRNRLLDFVAEEKGLKKKGDLLTDENKFVVYEMKKLLKKGL